MRTEQATSGLGTAKSADLVKTAASGDVAELETKWLALRSLLTQVQLAKQPDSRAAVRGLLCMWLTAMLTPIMQCTSTSCLTQCCLQPQSRL